MKSPLLACLLLIFLSLTVGLPVLRAEENLSLAGKSPTPAPVPHVLIVDMGKTLRVKGVTYLARQDIASGRVGECEVYLSNDSSNWGQPAATAKLDNTGAIQTMMFKTPRLRALSQIRGEIRA